MPFQWTVIVSQRLDAFLADMNPEVSRARVQRAIETGRVEVNGEEAAKSSLRLREGDSVVLAAEWDDSSRETTVRPADLRLPVLYEDDDCLVLNKPAGIAVHPGAGIADEEATILHGVAFLFFQRGLPFSTDAVLAHRLDKETTGCLLVAKNAAVHRLLQKQFADRDVRKTYLAMVAGEPDPPKAIIDAPIGRNLTDRMRMSVLRTSVSREARTTYRTLESTGKVTLLQCEIHTGRTHQIRVHLSSVGHPVLGDTLYGSSASCALTEEMGIGCMCLHAWKLVFLSPTSVREIEVVAPLSVAFLSALENVSMQVPS